MAVGRPLHDVIGAAIASGDLEGEADHLTAELVGPLMFRHVLLGAGLPRSQDMLSIVAAAALRLAAATAGATGAFARPIGYIAEGVTRVSGAACWLRRVYHEPIAASARMETS